MAAHWVPDLGIVLALSKTFSAVLVRQALKALGTVIAVDPSIMHGNAQIEACEKDRHAGWGFSRDARRAALIFPAQFEAL